MIIDDLQSLARPIESLTVLPGNPRRGDIKALAKSLAQFGQRKAIVVRTDGTVIAGNHTLLAARSLGWHEIAAVMIDEDEASALAYALADNRTAEIGGFEPEALRDLIATVHDLDPSLLDATGYEADLIDKLLHGNEGDASIDHVVTVFGVVVDVDTERQQIELLERLNRDGYRVRALLS